MSYMVKNNFDESELYDYLQGRGKILIVSCESGGAKILKSFADHIKTNYIFSLEGPAENIFPEGIKKESLEIIKDLDPEKNLILTGTSWIPDFERKAISIAKKNGIETWSFLDHWTNYRERFLSTESWEKLPSNWSDYLPDKVIVPDKYAWDIAEKLGFPNEKLFYVPNFSLEDFKISFEEKAEEFIPEDKNSINVLFISEPIADDLEKTFGKSDYWGYTEFDVVKNLVDACREHEKSKLRLRLHPNEPKNKFTNILRECSNSEISDNKDIIDDFLWADIVVGIHSMALVLALTAEKKTFSYLPPEAENKCFLPHKEINRINNPEDIFR